MGVKSSSGGSASEVVSPYTGAPPRYSQYAQFSFVEAWAESIPQKSPILCCNSSTTSDISINPAVLAYINAKRQLILGNSSCQGSFSGKENTKVRPHKKRRQTETPFYVRNALEEVTLVSSASPSLLNVDQTKSSRGLPSLLVNADESKGSRKRFDNYPRKATTSRKTKIARAPTIQSTSSDADDEAEAVFSSRSMRLVE
ncbi:MAG: hypothetical protein M1827_007742 [Pycnora praestabilis]|nr:MAG: hypothetical protein M1827_007742 [Pycnora praestabilis]